MIMDIIIKAFFPREGRKERERGLFLKDQLLFSLSGRHFRLPKDSFI